MDRPSAGTSAEAGRTWLASMPANVGQHRQLLERLLDAVERDPTYRWVELGCSLARGAGDELSDIDAAAGVADDSWPAAVDRTERLVAGLAPVMDQFRHPMPGRDGRLGWHLVTIYRGGLQLSLVVLAASWRPGLPPDSVALYDLDGQLARGWRPDETQADEPAAAQWLWEAWLALGDVAKYLDRGSLWEAHARLEEARTRIWRLWAVAERLDYPAFGLTAVLDAATPRLPAGIAGTVAGLDADEVRAAAVRATVVLTDVAERAAQVLPITAPRTLPAWVTHRLTGT